MLFLLQPDLEDINEVDTDPKGKFVSLKVTISNESSLFMPLQGVAHENSWLGVTFFKDYKMREMKTNNALET